MSFPYLVYSHSFPEMGGRTVHAVLHPTRPRWAMVNETGLFILQRLSDTASMENIAKDLAHRYRIPSWVADQDTQAFASRWKEKGMGPPFGPLSGRTVQLDSVDVAITSRCNLSCRHCSVGCSPGEMSRDLPTDRLLRLWEEAAVQGTRRLFLSGGEPLLHPDLELLLTKAAGLFSTGVLSNGTLLTPRLAAMLKELNIHIQVSIDSADPDIHDFIRGPGALAKTLQGLQYLKQADSMRNVVLACTLMDHNFAATDGLIELAERLEVAQLRFLSVRKKGNAARNWSCLGTAMTSDQTEDQYRDIMRKARDKGLSLDISCGMSGIILHPQDDGKPWCPLGQRVSIDVDGCVYPCPLLEGPDFVLGNVLTDDWGAIQGTLCQSHLAQKVVARKEARQECRSCPWKNLCQAGCMGMALHDSGSVDNVDHHCAFRKQCYQESFQKLMLLFLQEGR